MQQEEKVMKLFDAFGRQAPNKVFLSIILGALSGVSYALLIPIVLGAINDNGKTVVESESHIRTFLSFEVSHYKIASVFLFVCVFILIARTLSQVILTRVSIDMTTEMRIKLYKRIMAASTDVLDRMGPSKLIATITMDVGRIVGGAMMFPDLLINLVTVVGMLGFLMFLNVEVFWFVIWAILFGAATYQIPVMISNWYFSHSRKKSDDLQESIRGLIYGAKELKLNEVKSQVYFKDVLVHNEYEVRKSDKVGNTIVRVAINYGDMISFFVIGIVTFIFVNYQAMSTDVLVGVVMALLYITGPIAVCIAAIPEVMVARISLNKVNKIFEELPIEDINHDIVSLPEWQSMIYHDVSYQYTNPDGSPGFKIGPLDFSINKSEVTFIIGGNGSGKSTLSKLLTLHHLPTSGVMSYGDTAIDGSNLKSCRQLISSIYSDYYLFDRLLDGNHEKQRGLIDQYLKELGLDEKVTIEDGRFSTLNLSEGQKRRLALLVVLLEDKDIYLFDEWAADQDPMFKEFFYRYVLKQLKDKGKAVIVISHDDRYFDLADKILIMEDGNLIDVVTDKDKISNRDFDRNIYDKSKQKLNMAQQTEV